MNAAADLTPVQAAKVEAFGIVHPEFDYIALARKVIDEIDPRELGWVFYPTIGRRDQSANDLGFDGTAFTISEPYCGPVGRIECDGDHLCGGDVLRVGAEGCEDCWVSSDVAQFIANAPATIRALLEEVDRLTAEVNRKVALLRVQEQFSRDEVARIRSHYDQGGLGAPGASDVIRQEARAGAFASAVEIVEGMAL